MRGMVVPRKETVNVRACEKNAGCARRKSLVSRVQSV